MEALKAEKEMSDEEKQHIAKQQQQQQLMELQTDYQGEGLTAMAVDMEPALWGTLPEELLQLVFSRLSVAEVCGLRLLCKDWKRKLDTAGSEFSRVLETTVYSRMFGFVVWRDPDYDERMRGRVLDVKGQRWYLGLDLT